MKSNHSVFIALLCSCCLFSLSAQEAVLEITHRWDQALNNKETEALTSLYADEVISFMFISLPNPTSDVKTVSDYYEVVMSESNEERNNNFIFLTNLSTSKGRSRPVSRVEYMV